MTLSESQGDVSGMAADDAPEASVNECEQLTTTRLAHYRETLCAVKPALQGDALCRQAPPVPPVLRLTLCAVKPLQSLQSPV